MTGGKEEKKEEALSEMQKKSINAFSEYASEFHKNCKSMWLAWIGENDIKAYLAKAQEDLSAIENWKKKLY